MLELRFELQEDTIMFHYLQNNALLPKSGLLYLCRRFGMICVAADNREDAVNYAMALMVLEELD